MVDARERALDGVKVPWFDVLFTIDPAFAAQSRFTFWIMGYRAEYFKHKKFGIDNNELTRENYLHQYAPERMSKIVKRFSGITMQLIPVEKEYLAAFFGRLGFQTLYSFPWSVGMVRSYSSAGPLGRGSRKRQPIDFCAGFGYQKGSGV